MLSIATFRQDPLYPQIARAVDELLRRSKTVAPVDLLVAMGRLTPTDLDDWRHGRIPYLERAIQGNLTRLARILRILRFHVHDLNLVPTLGIYTRSGRGPLQHLRFTKTGEAGLEEAYRRHFTWPGKRPFPSRVSDGPTP